MRIFFSDFLYKNMYCWYSFELEVIQMSTNNICFYKEADKSKRALVEDYEIAWLCDYKGICGNTVKYGIKFF